MHFRGCDQRTYPDLVPGVVLYVHDTLSLSRVPREDCRIDVRGAELVLTYGSGAEWDGEKTCFQQFRTHHPSSVGQKESVPVPKAPGQTLIDDILV